MRPLRLEVEGFTAFRAPTVVDFDGADLFALTGPTGSGKTSLLDAMVFALYGSVPRLADQRQVAPVIAQGMAEARVRLDFATGSDAFTATRIVRRTKSGASTSEARLELDGEVLAGSADDVTAAVTQRLGLTYEQFTKCVMLPQGEFARFLHDKPAARQDLLISLLDLGVYADMAERARQRATDAKHEAAVLEARLDDVAAATPEAIAAAAARVEQLEGLVRELDALVPELVALDADAATARQRLQTTLDELALLRTVRVPDGVDDLHQRGLAAGDALVAAAAAVQVAETALTTAEAQLAAAGDRTQLARWLDGHERAVGFEERRVKAEVVVVERAADLAAAAIAMAEAAATFDAARAAEEAAAAAHRAHAVRADLVEGEACPVCLQTVAAIPSVRAPAAISKARTVKDKAERDHRHAADAHAAAAQSLAVAESSLAGIVADLAAERELLADAPRLDAVRARLDEHAAASTVVDSARAELGAVRARHAAAVAERDDAATAEHAARTAYDECRDAVAALKPPARRSTATLLDEWAAMGEWAEREASGRADATTELETTIATLATQRSDRLAALAARCAAADLAIPSGSEPAAAAREALGRAGADHELLVRQAETAAQLREDFDAVESRSALARGLATHLDARHFEKWLLGEAMVALADGATETLMALSADQYSLRVDKAGAFVVVDHRNADEIRSARTLSGGETFLASLALALALADRISSLAARGAARLESIFLDEGFGTLDPDTLDVVASAIEELGATGRMVGVVSHVAELAERLPVRYEVSRTANAATVHRVDR